MRDRERERERGREGERERERERVWFNVGFNFDVELIYRLNRISISIVYSIHVYLQFI